MTFTDAHSGGSTCKPSRYSLMTGRFNFRAEHYNDRSGPILQEKLATVPGMLRDLGYRTAMVGKWHLGFDRKSAKKKGEKPLAFGNDGSLTGGPCDRGFDSFFGMHASLDIPPYFYIRDREPTMPPTETVPDNNSLGGKEDWNRIQGAFWRGGPVGPDFKHVEVTPRFANEASKVIASHDGDRPLFLYLALPSPHTPWLPTKAFAGKSRAGMYGDFVTQVDHVVGEIVSELDKAGMSENTLLLFTSDNGPVWYDKDTQRFGHSAAGSLRGIKGSVWEGGHRMPFIVKWPSRVKARSRTDQLVAFADVLATFAEIASKKNNATTTAKDSVSFADTLLTQQTRDRTPIMHAGKTIRDGDWKLIVGSGGRGFSADRRTKYPTELFNLKEDVGEQNNLAEKMPEKVESLREKIKAITGE
ncbi:MAG: sulfatase-like hydrolase/transferase, partial [Planctomycetales bacterium]